MSISWDGGTGLYRWPPLPCLKNLTSLKLVKLSGDLTRLWCGLAESLLDCPLLKSLSLAIDIRSNPHWSGEPFLIGLVEEFDVVKKQRGRTDHHLKLENLDLDSMMLRTEPAELTKLTDVSCLKRLRLRNYRRSGDTDVWVKACENMLCPLSDLRLETIIVDSISDESMSLITSLRQKCDCLNRIHVTSPYLVGINDPNKLNDTSLEAWLARHSHWESFLWGAYKWRHDSIQVSSYEFLIKAALRNCPNIMHVALPYMRLSALVSCSLCTPSRKSTDLQIGLYLCTASRTS